MIDRGLSQRPLPQPSALSELFWAACKEQRLTVQRCNDCGAKTFPPEGACIRCLSTALEWVSSTGKGRVYSYTVVHRPPTPAFAVPFVLAVVDMEDGFSMMSNVVDCDPSEVNIGMPVEVKFVEVSSQISLPMFRPAQDSRGSLEADSKPAVRRVVAKVTVPRSRRKPIHEE